MVHFPPGPEHPSPPSGRTRHPFFMHEMMRQQPVAIQATLGVLPDEATRIPPPPQGGRVLFVGIGTSYHAALGTSFMAGAVARGALRPEARSSFDLLDDPSLLEGADVAVVFSSSGETAVTNAALEAMAGRGIRTVLVTGSGSGTASKLAGDRLVTRYAEETSWTHTVSYSAALAAGRVLLGAWVPKESWAGAEAATIVDAVTEALKLEEKVQEAVERLSPANSILLLGSGPAEATVREAALKLREAAGRFAATGGVEEFLHGMLPSVGDSTAVIAVTGTPLEFQRAREGLAAARSLGAPTLLVDSSGGAALESEWSISVLPPAIAPIAQVMPFQLMAYWMAVAEGRNPDVMGLDDPRYMAARRTFGI